MIRRRPKKRGASAFSGLALPKGRTRAQEKVGKRAAEVEVIKLVRERVMNRAQGRCEVCWARGYALEMHEAYPRSLTRGRPAMERFDPRFCVAVDRACHIDLTKHKVELWFKDSLGANGVMAPIKITGWLSAKDVWERVVGETRGDK